MLPKYELSPDHMACSYYLDFEDKKLDNKLCPAITFDVGTDFIGLPMNANSECTIKYKIDSFLYKLMGLNYLYYDNFWEFDSDAFVFDEINYDVRNNCFYKPNCEEDLLSNLVMVKNIIPQSKQHHKEDFSLLCQCLIDYHTGKFFPSFSIVGAERIETLQKFFNCEIFDKAVEEYQNELVLKLAGVPEEN